MLQEIVKNLQIICDYKINEIAAMNILQSKLSYIMSFKGCKFQSIQNVGRFTPLAYYAFNFVPSGGIKNRLLTEIDTHLLNFFNDYLKKYNEERFDKLECDWTLKLQKITDKVELRRKKMECESELKAFKELKKEITNSTQAKIYNSLEIINNAGEGALMIVNSEFANYYEDAILNKDKMKKEFLDMMYNLYDGEFQGTDTVSTSRDNISNMPTACIFLSDYKLLLENEKLSNAFKSYLARGMARRSFIYFKKNENFYTENMIYPTFDDKSQAIDNLKIFSNKLKFIFEQIQKNKQYSFNQAANEEINRYKENVNKKIAEFYKYTNVLDLNSEILKLNLEHSTWKIIKLAVLYHILENPTSTFVTVENFRKAVNFFEQTHACLEEMLQDKLISDYDTFYNYLVKNRNKFISKMDLRNEKFVSNREFKSWFDDALINISEMCENKGFSLVTRVVGKRNQGIEIALYEPEKFRFEPEFDGKFQKGRLVKIDNSDLEVSEL